MSSILCIALEKVLFFQQKVLVFFLLLHENIHCWYPLEVPLWGASNEYLQRMFFFGEISKIFIQIPLWPRANCNMVGDLIFYGQTVSDCGQTMQITMCMQNIVWFATDQLKVYGVLFSFSRPHFNLQSVKQNCSSNILFYFFNFSEKIRLGILYAFSVVADHSHVMSIKPCFLWKWKKAKKKKKKKRKRETKCRLLLLCCDSHFKGLVDYWWISCHNLQVVIWVECRVNKSSWSCHHLTAYFVSTIL